MGTPSYIGQGHEVMPELRMKASSCIGKGHEVMPELRMNAPSWIGQGHEAIHREVLAESGRAMKLC